MRLSPIQCNCGQNSICLEQFNCSCLNASLSGTDELVCNGKLSEKSLTKIIILHIMLASFHYTAITCPPLTAPTNGFVTYNSTSDENGNYAFNAMANHSCDTGFVLVGNNTRTCTGNGSNTTGAFDGEAAICERELIMQNITVNSYFNV